MGGISESPTTKPEGVDGAEMANEEWKTFVQDRREVSAGKGDKVFESSRVRSYYEGKASREENWQAVRRAAKTYCPEDREV